MHSDAEESPLYTKQPDSAVPQSEEGLKKSKKTKRSKNHERENPAEDEKKLPLTIGSVLDILSINAKRVVVHARCKVVDDEFTDGDIVVRHDRD